MFLALNWQIGANMELWEEWEKEEKQRNREGKEITRKHSRKTEDTRKDQWDSVH